MLDKCQESAPEAGLKMWGLYSCEKHDTGKRYQGDIVILLYQIIGMILAILHGE